MQRCARCLLTSSLPDSRFDGEGVCSWCRSGYPNYRPLGAEALQRELATHRRLSAPADCLVGVSGGKDSSYVLVQLKQTFGMRVEAFTYEHDGVTDFARRNVRSVCESAGVRLHVVSLPGHAHLEAFRTFFSAWLRSPGPVCGAMICVACKHLHTLGCGLAMTRGIPMMVWSTCPLEYAPFLAIKKGQDAMKRQTLLRSALLLAGEAAGSSALVCGVMRHLPLVLKGCLAFAPTTGYIRLRYPSLRHLFFFQYCAWNESVIRGTLRASTPWSVPPEIAQDWHSDCIFNIFKEYIFQSSLGVTYTDAFLSNRIRHGLITRTEAVHCLAESKRFFAAQLPRATGIAGLESLADRLDASCFEKALQGLT